MQNRKDFIPVEELESFYSQLNEVSRQAPNIEGLVTKDEIKDIIESQEKGKKKVNKYGELDSYRQEQKLNGFLYRAKSELKKTRSSIKNNHRRILANTKMARQNKAAGASTFKKIVSSIKTKIEKF